MTQLDHYFQKHMTLDMEFDERLFINQEGKLRTPLKILGTLSSRQKIQTPPVVPPKKVMQSGSLKRPKLDQDASYQRQLDFTLKSESLRETLSNPQFSQQTIVMQSPVANYAPAQTPITQMMEVRRWITDLEQQRESVTNEAQTSELK